ncbi:hypothetical protein [Streptomyces sp. MAI_2237]
MLAERRSVFLVLSSDAAKGVITDLADEQAVSALVIGERNPRRIPVQVRSLGQATVVRSGPVLFLGPLALRLFRSPVAPVFLLDEVQVAEPVVDGQNKVA